MPNLDNVFVVSGNGDPLSDMVLSGNTVAEAAKDPIAIGRLLVDMAYSEGAEDLDNYTLYYERSSNPTRLLERWETGMEDFLTGGWVRVLSSPNQSAKELSFIGQMIRSGTAADHGCYRGVRLVEFFPIKS